MKSRDHLFLNEYQPTGALKAKVQSAATPLLT